MISTDYLQRPYITDQWLINMASLAEELKQLSLPAPDKINLDNFEDDLTRARVISKDDICQNDSETEEITRSNLRKKAAILLADEDQRYAGKTTSRKQRLKLREDSAGDFPEELSDDGTLGAVL